MDVLNQYHTTMGTLIARYAGTVEHFAGDGLMVLFNDPLPCPDPELQAVRMAIEMREQMDELAQAWRRRGYQLGFGVGITHGYATLGQIGFEGRLHYAAIGSVVNLAARLCGEAKDGQILASRRVGLAIEQDRRGASGRRPGPQRVPRPGAGRRDRRPGRARGAAVVVRILSNSTRQFCDSCHRLARLTRAVPLASKGRVQRSTATGHRDGTAEGRCIRQWRRSGAGAWREKDDDAADSQKRCQWMRCSIVRSRGWTTWTTTWRRWRRTTRCHEHEGRIETSREPAWYEPRLSALRQAILGIF